MFLAGFVLAGLDARFGWIVLPGWVSWAAAGVFLLAYALYAEVLRENTYLSRTVEVQEDQKPCDLAYDIWGKGRGAGAYRGTGYYPQECGGNIKYLSD